MSLCGRCDGALAVARLCRPSAWCCAPLPPTLNSWHHHLPSCELRHDRSFSQKIKVNCCCLSVCSSSRATQIRSSTYTFRRSGWPPSSWHQPRAYLPRHKGRRRRRAHMLPPAPGPMVAFHRRGGWRRLMSSPHGQAAQWSVVCGRCYASALGPAAQCFGGTQLGTQQDTWKLPKLSSTMFEQPA